MPPRQPIHNPADPDVNVFTPPSPEKKANPATGKIEYSAGVVDIEDLMNAQARDLADHRMSESREDRTGNWLMRTGRRIWKHNLFQTYYRARENINIKRDQRRTGNFLVGEDGHIAVAAGTSAYLDSNSDANKAMLAAVGRFTSEYEEDNLRAEERTSKNRRNIPAIKELIDRYATTPGMTSADFEAERRNILSGEIGRDFTENEARYADNFFKIATEIRDSVVHGKNIADFDVKTEVILGRARESLHSQENRTTFEHFWGTIKDSRIGQIVGNEAVAQLIGAGLFSIGKLGVGTVKSKLFAWLTGATTGGATIAISAGIAGLNENLRLNRERGQHQRDLARGKRFTEGDMKRRKEIHESRYETRNARTMIDTLNQDLTTISAAHTPAQLNSAIAHIAELESRIRLANRHNIDLVDYSHSSQMEIERARLGDLLGGLKQQIRTIQGIPAGSPIPILDSVVNTQMDALMAGDTGIERRNELFNRMKTEKISKRVAATFVFGAAFQEIIGTVGNIVGAHGPETLLTDAYKHVTHWNAPKGTDIGLNNKTTLADGFVRHFFENKPRIPFGTGHEAIFDASHVHLPDGSDMLKNSDGTFNILVGGKIIGDHLPLKFLPNGDFDDATKALLAKSDIYSDLTHSTSTTTPSDYFKKHPEGTAKVHFNHLGNDTKEFDKNELRADLIKKDGKYYYDMHRMKDAKWIPSHDEVVQDPVTPVPAPVPTIPPVVEHIKIVHSAENGHFTVDERRLMNSVGGQAVKNNLKDYFPKHGFLGLGRHGMHSPDWKIVSDQPASAFLKDHFDQGTPLADLQNDLKQYVSDLHLKPPSSGQSLEDYYKHVQEMRAGQLIINGNSHPGGLHVDQESYNQDGIGSDHSGRVLSKLDRDGDLGGTHSSLWKEMKNDSALDFLNNKPVVDPGDPDSLAKLDLWKDMHRTMVEAHAGLPSGDTSLKDYLNYVNSLKKEGWDNSGVTEDLDRLRSGENLDIKAIVIEKDIVINPIPSPVPNPNTIPIPVPHSHTVQVGGHWADPQSYKGTHYVNPHEEMLKGHIKTLFSVSRDVQHNPIMVDTDVNGLAQVPDKFVSLIHEDANGHLTSEFKFVQIALPTKDLGNNEYNMDILATDPGKGIDVIGDTTADIKLSLPEESEMYLPLITSPRRPLERGSNRGINRANPRPGPGPAPLFTDPQATAISDGPRLIALTAPERVAVRAAVKAALLRKPSVASSVKIKSAVSAVARIPGPITSSNVANAVTSMLPVPAAEADIVLDCIVESAKALALSRGAAMSPADVLLLRATLLPVLSAPVGGMTIADTVTTVTSIPAPAMSPEAARAVATAIIGKTPVPPATIVSAVGAARGAGPSVALVTAAVRALGLPRNAAQAPTIVAAILAERLAPVGPVPAADAPALEAALLGVL